VTAIRVEVNRSRRSRSISASIDAGVRRGTRLGAEQRSTSRRSPARHRASQRYTVRSETPWAAATSEIFQDSSSTRWTSSKRLDGTSLALA